MERSTDINLLCLSKLKISGADEGMPVLFKYGDRFKVDAQLIFTIGMSQFYRLAQEMQKNPDGYGHQTYVYSSLNYVYFQDNTQFVHTIETYELDIDEKHLHNTLFESNNCFHINTLKLPRERNIRLLAHFELSVTWNTQKDSDVRNPGFKIPLPIFEQTAEKEL